MVSKKKDQKKTQSGKCGEQPGSAAAQGKSCGERPCRKRPSEIQKKGIREEKKEPAHII